MFNEYEDINVSRCISTKYREKVFSHGKDNDITELIPTSCRTTVSFEDNNCDMVIDTGADMTIVRLQHLSGDGYRNEYCGKINLIPAFGQIIEADLVMVQCRLVNKDLIPPPIFTKKSLKS